MEQSINDDKSIPKLPLPSAASMKFNDLLMDSTIGNTAAALPSPESTNPSQSPAGEQENTDHNPSQNDVKEIPSEEYYKQLVEHLEKGLDGKNARANAVAICLYFLLSRKLSELEMMPHLYLVVDHKFPSMFFIERFKKLFPKLLVIRKGDSVKSIIFKFVPSPAPPLLFLDFLGIEPAIKDLFINRASEKEGKILFGNSELDVFSSRIILTKTPPSIKVRRYSIVLFLDSLKGAFFKIDDNEEFKVICNGKFLEENNTISSIKERKSDLSNIEPTFWLRQISDVLLEKEIITEDDHNAVLQLFDRNSAALKRDYEYNEDLEILMWIQNYINDKPEKRTGKSNGEVISMPVSLQSISEHIIHQSDYSIKPSLSKLHRVMADYDVAIKYFRKDVSPKVGNSDGLNVGPRKQLTHVIIDLGKLRSILDKE